MTLQRFNQLPRERVYPAVATLAAIEAETALRSVTRLYILSSATLAKPGGPVEAIARQLGTVCAGIGTALSEHTPLHAVIETAARLRAAEVDMIVAIGGGSVIDGAKAVKAAIAGGLDTVEAFAPFSAVNAAPAPVPTGGPTLIAVPTTLSAAEFSGTAGYTNPLSGLKEGLRAPHLAPAAVILDPDLALHTPLRLWTSSGVRAVDHAVETIFSPHAWTSLRAKAATGLAMLAEALRAAHADPADPSARSNAQQAVWLIGDCSAQLTMGASHGLGYLLGSIGHVPHGLTSCILLPTVVAWNTPMFPQAAQQVASALASDNAVDGLRSLIAALDLPTRISDCVADKNVLDAIAAYALNHPVVRVNPRPFADDAEVRALLERAW